MTLLLPASPQGVQTLAVSRRPWRRRTVLLVPLLVFVGIGVFLGFGLTHDPRLVPSPLIGKPVPVFSLPPVRGRSLGLSSTDLRDQVSLVNVFASWCVACREEHPVLMGIERQGIVPIYGLNYKDQPGDAEAWLTDMGDPYARTGADLDGRVAIDWGVYGVPETFVVDRDGRIAYKQIGAITPTIWNQTLLPLIRKLQVEHAGHNDGQS
jgi:cytochrome c biogenesis protein CcmG/thiol:disulfide interchange protein DsbE